MTTRAERFRVKAVECYVAAQKAKDPETRDAYLELMRHWRELADEIERFEHAWLTGRGYESLFRPAGVLFASNARTPIHRPRFMIGSTAEPRELVCPSSTSIPTSPLRHSSGIPWRRLAARNPLGRASGRLPTKCC